MEYFGVTMLLKCADPHLPTDRNNRQEWIDPETQLCVVEIAGAVYAVLLEIVQSFWLTFLQFKAIPCGLELWRRQNTVQGHRHRLPLWQA